MPPTHWIFPSDQQKGSYSLLAEVVEQWGVPEVWGRLFLERSKAASLQELEYFLRPRLAHLSSPEKIAGMEAMARRLCRAVEQHEKLLLFGDYDVDGIASLAMLQRFLAELGLVVTTFLPDRTTEGYGLSQAALERAISTHHPQLLLALDCGTNSHEAASWLEQEGVELLIIDHHEPAQPPLKNAASLASVMINPKLGHEEQPQEGFAAKELRGDTTIFCTAALVFKLMHMMVKLLKQEKSLDLIGQEGDIDQLDLKRYLDLAALGIVADIAPMEGENRLIVRHGLRQLEQSVWVGLHSLVKVAQVQAPFTAATLGFQLAPRINAVGRLGSAEAALKLLTTDDPDEAERLASALHQENQERQKIERQLVAELHQLMEQSPDLEQRSSIVLGRPGWHQGILGIAAARIAKKWHRPTLVVSFDQEGKGKGSGRSVEGCSLVAALENCREHLQEFGGHMMAAGITVQKESFSALQEAFEEQVVALWQSEDKRPKRTISALIDLTEIREEWLTWQDHLGPFGSEHPQPLFVARDLWPARPPRILKEKHYLLELIERGSDRASNRQKVHRPWRGIFFHGAEHPLPEPPWEVAFTIERNSFRGVTQLQLHLVEVRAQQ